MVYTDGAAVRGALADLAAAYQDARVEAWTVWVPEDDRETADALAAAGHRLDGAPRAMAAPLEELDLGEGAAGLDWRQTWEMDDVAAIAGPAFGDTPEVARVAAAGLTGAVRFVVAGDHACAGTLDVNGDCGVYLVSTRSEARGRGLASALMRQALLDARRRGLQTTSLQATAMGAPIYARLGYRDLGAIQMWERRR